MLTQLWVHSVCTSQGQEDQFYQPHYLTLCQPPSTALSPFCSTFSVPLGWPPKYTTCPRILPWFSASGETHLPAASPTQLTLALTSGRIFKVTPKSDSSCQHYELTSSGSVEHLLSPGLHSVTLILLYMVCSWGHLHILCRESIV